MLAETLLKFQTEIHAVERSLRHFDDSQQPSNPDAPLICTHCQGGNPADAKMRHNCDKLGPTLRACTRESRIAEYFSCLEFHELWPSVEAFTTLSPATILELIEDMRDVQVHGCDAGEGCRLKLELKRLYIKCSGFLDSLSVLSEEFCALLRSS